LPKVKEEETIRLKLPSLEQYTSRAYATVSLAALLFVLGIIFAREESATLLSLSLFLLLLLTASNIFMKAEALALRKLIVEREAPEIAIEGRELKVTTIIRNPTIIPLEYAEVVLNYPTTFKLVKGSPKAVLTIPPKSEIKLTYTLLPRIGIHTFPPLRITIRDFFGFFRSTINIGRPFQIKIYPKPVSIVGFRGSYSAKPAGLSRAKRKGYGIEFYGVREYVPGDEYKWIEWKASARFGGQRFFVKEFEHEVSLNIFLVLDLRSPAFTGSWGNTAAEYVARAALAIANYSLRKGDSVGLVYIGDRRSHILPLERGVRGLTSITKELARIEWPTTHEIIGLNYTYLANVLRKNLPRYLPRERNVLVIFSTLHYGEGLEKFIDVLKELQARNNIVFMIVPMVEFFEATTLKGVQAAIYRIRAVKAIEEKQKTINTLLRSGIAAVTVGPHDIVDVAIRKLETIRAVM